MQITIEIRGDKEIAARFADAPARRLRLTAAMDAHLALLHAAVTPLTPVGVTANLRNSWMTVNNLPGAFSGILGSPLVYAPVIEDGRTPGAQMPPPDALRAWVTLKMGAEVSAYVVARSIGRKGIRGRHMLFTALEMTRPAAKAIWDAAGASILEG